MTIIIQRQSAKMFKLKSSMTRVTIKRSNTKGISKTIRKKIDNHLWKGPHEIRLSLRLPLRNLSPKILNKNKVVEPMRRRYQLKSNRGKVDRNIEVGPNPIQTGSIRLFNALKWRHEEVPAVIKLQLGMKVITTRNDSIGRRRQLNTVSDKGQISRE